MSNSFSSRQRDMMPSRSRRDAESMNPDSGGSSDGDRKHPGLEGFSRLGTQVQHVGMGIFKGGLIGGAVGGAIAGTAAAALGAGAIFAGGPFTLIPAAIASLTPAVGWATGLLGTAAVSGMMTGAAIGGTGSGLWALSNASEAADIAEDKAINKFEMAQARTERLDRLREARDRQQMAMERQETQMRGQNPNRNLPERKMAGMEGPAYT
jgi:hypothetical protein